MVAEGLQWDEGSSQAFLDYGRYFVPEREIQIQIICDLIAEVDAPFDVLELCCGEGLLAGAILERFPQATVYGFDGSEAMLEAAAKNLAHYGARFKTRRFDLGAQAWRQLSWSPQAVVSSLAIHHLDGREKQVLFQDIHALLAPGGTFVIADVIQPAGKLGTTLAAAAWDEVVRQQALALDGHQKAYEYFQREGWNMFRYDDPIDKPSTLFEQLSWLEAAGFTAVDAYWMQAGHAIFGGRKPNL